MILVTGARGVVGTPLCQRLADSGQHYMMVSRGAGNQAIANDKQIDWDLARAPSERQREQLQGVETLIHCAPIWLLPDQLKVFGASSLRRLIVFSSTSVLSKHNSSDGSEQLLVKRLADAETSISELCGERGWNLTILRPSMIYGYGRDQNVTHIARFIRRFGLMFVVGAGSGKRQPVHADDLVDVGLRILDDKTSFGQVYNLAGGEVLSYRDMVERIFIGLGKSPRVLSLPLCVFRSGLRLAALFTRFSYTPEMANRMNQDLIYDCSAATKDFGYAPSSFLTDPARDLGIDV